MPDSANAAPRQPVLPLAGVLAAIASPTRWAILREMADGRPFAVVELAERLRETPTGISKHMAVLRNSGIVDLGRNRCYSISPAFLADKTKRIVDFGWCLLRLDTIRDKA